MSELRRSTGRTQPAGWAGRLLRPSTTRSEPSLRPTPRARRLAAVSLATAATLLVAVGCSRDTAGDDLAPASSASPASTAAAIAPSKKFTLPAPVKLVALIGDKTNSKDPNAINDFNDGARLAVEDINAVGGIGGHPVEFAAVDTSPTGQDVDNSFNLALEQKPTALLGPVSSTTALALLARINQAGVPILQNSTDGRLATDGPSGSPWMFGTRPRNDTSAQRATEFATSVLGAKKLGLLRVDTAFGQQGETGVKAGLAGTPLVSDKSFAYNATDLTGEVSSMAQAGAQAVIDWGTPNTLALTVKTFAQQGLRDVPHIGPGSVGFSSFATGVGDPALLDNVYGAVDCNPQDDPSRPQVGAWFDRFKAKYGYTPSYGSAELYDSVLILREVIEKAGSADPAAIRDGLKSLSGFAGICSASYANKDGFLISQVVMGRYQNGVFKTQKVYAD
ncbi:MULTISPECIES: ABC transporter substrate-binding protein [unclassified Pseudofrankia]|uniref:ABC transporter substrate-binding protein n=1 Tax=unclassified Pseudofrankia TaxID=2994372 RepID=UPI0012FF70C8|nr:MULTISPECIES: ABC transporter substrate-binding protein [unclassified Pseudofrankia]MDT3440264.1 ABC transporter substrate-binding protein [Pseudofrankia sp. BMG5.37]